MLCTNSQMHFSGSGTFVGNGVGSAIIIRSINMYFNGYLKFYEVLLFCCTKYCGGI